MKAIIITVAAAAALLAGAISPASANEPNRYQSGNGYGYHGHVDHAPYEHRRHYVYERPAPPPHYRYYHGRQVARYGGRWGYWAPRNGLSVFITVPL